MFNKGLTTNERSEGLLKSLKNIEDNTDNQLDLIRDQGDRQLDRINKANSEKIDDIKFFSEKSKELGDLIKKKTKENDNKNYTYTAADNTLFDFGSYNLKLMGNKFFIRDITIDVAKREQEKMLKNIEELELRANPKKGKLKKVYG